MRGLRFERVLWATPIGAPDWQEDLITAIPMDPGYEDHMARARAWARREGFDRFREKTMLLPRREARP